MTPADRQELDAILREQLRLRNLAAALDQRIAALDRSLTSPAPAEPPPVPKAAPSSAPPPPAPAPARPAPISIPQAPKSAPPPIPPTPPRQAVPAESIELKLGTYWLARIGIVILLTGFVFLGNYAYRHIVPHLGAWGKLSLLALGGAALGGAGAWLERGRESMRNYARVLLAGGAATFYYTAYAAHFVAPLRVIESPLLGGALLLALAGAFLWFAERRRSQSLALSAVLLSYYTAAINPIGTFSLFSNLLLTAVATVFLVRHRWTAISFASLAATYGSYGFWRFHALAATGQSGVGEFGTALAFLAGYWLLFTAAVFLSHRDALPPAQRMAFLTANNGALFAYAAQHFSAHRPDAFWMFALGYGAVLLLLAAFAARRRPDEPSLDGAYLAQGLALVALGCAAKLSGPQLATVFAVESAVLLTLSRTRHRWLYEIAAGLCALAAFVLALDAIGNNPALTISLGGTVALILLFDAWWVKHLRGELATLQRSGRALGFAVLGLVLAGAVIWKSVAQPWQPAALAIAALACAVSVRAVRLPEIALPGQVFLFVAVSAFVVRHLGAAPDPAWSPLPLLVIALTLTHWWQRQRDLALSAEPSAMLQLACAAAAFATGLCWLHATQAGDAWIIALSAAALGTLIYGTITRAWAVTLVGQLFTVLSVQAYLSDTFAGGANPSAAFAPIANLVVLTHWWQHQRTLTLTREATGAMQLACAAGAAACGMVWLHASAKADAWLIGTSAVALGTLIYGAVTRAWAIALVGQLFTVLSTCAFLVGVAWSRIAIHFVHHQPGSSAALAPIANLAVTALLLSRVAGSRFPTLPTGDSFAQLAMIYRLAASALLGIWGLAFIDGEWMMVFFAALGAAHVFGGALLRDRERSITGVVFASIAFAIFWTPAGNSIAWRDLVAILALPASVRLGQRFAGTTALPPAVRNGLVAIALASVWLWVTRYATAHDYRSGLTAAWAVLALLVFIAGLALRERVYRVGGFAILALAVGRIFIVDVWQLETLYRILSFLVLGAVLLLLGYLYNRFADSIRRWL